MTHGAAPCRGTGNRGPWTAAKVAEFVTRLVHDGMHVAQHADFPRVPGNRELIHTLRPADAVDMRPLVPFHIQQAALDSNVADDSAEAAETRILIDVTVHLCERSPKQPL